MPKTITIDVAIKKLLFLLGLLIISPITLNVAFKAIRVFKTAPKIYLAYGLLIVGATLIIFTVYFGFKTFKTILNLIFKN